MSWARSSTGGSRSRRARSNVTLEAYSPLGTGRHISDERMRQIAERVGRTPA
jgi:diketogulonate reductase-like aldo/keto reductase